MSPHALWYFKIENTNYGHSIYKKISHELLSTCYGEGERKFCIRNSEIYDFGVGL